MKRKSTGLWVRIPGLVLLCLTMSLAGCDEHRLAEGQPAIELTPESLSFRTLNVFEEDLQRLAVLSIGTASLIISEIRLEGDSVFGLQEWNGGSFSAGGFPDSLAPRDGDQTPSKELVLVFAPEQEGDFSADLIVVSNDEQEPSLRVNLSGKCSVPNIEVVPESLDFGGVGLSSSASLSLSIRNTGESDLLLLAADVALGSGAADSPFIWRSDDLTIGPGDQDVMHVLYTPTQLRLDPVSHAVLADEDTLLLYSNDSDDNPVSVGLRGIPADNVPPLVGIKVIAAEKITGAQLPDPCALAPSDLATLEAEVVDPEGADIGNSHLTWRVEKGPVGSRRLMLVPADDAFHPGFKPDVFGQYTVCLEATDPQGNVRAYDVDAACTCAEANAQAAGSFACPCLQLNVVPREDIHVELTWDRLGPDLDLHLVAPGGEFCSPTQECRYNAFEPDDPDWAKVACVQDGPLQTCRQPNCDPFAAGCADGQECYDDGAGPACHWQRCSGSDCFWDGRNPDWGLAGQSSDDPLLAIDCGQGCRAETFYLSLPESGNYRLMVNYYPPDEGMTRATVRVYFKGDALPVAEYSSELNGICDTWNVAQIEWVDRNDHQVVSLGDSHTELCCD